MTRARRAAAALLAAGFVLRAGPPFYGFGPAPYGYSRAADVEDMSG